MSTDSQNDTPQNPPSVNASTDKGYGTGYFAAVNSRIQPTNSEVPTPEQSPQTTLDPTQDASPNEGYGSSYFAAVNKRQANHQKTSPPADSPRTPPSTE